MARVLILNAFSLFVVGTLYILFMARVGMFFSAHFVREFANGFYVFGTLLGALCALGWVIMAISAVADIYENTELAGRRQY